MFGTSSATRSPRATPRAAIPLAAHSIRASSSAYEIGWSAKMNAGLPPSRWATSRTSSARVAGSGGTVDLLGQPTVGLDFLLCSLNTRFENRLRKFFSEVPAADRAALQAKFGIWI